MKKLFVVLSIGIGLAACGGGSDPAPGGTIDSNVTPPATENPSDNTNVHPDSIAPNTEADTNTIIDLNNRNDSRDGTSSGESGSSTNSNNSGSAKDDNKGNK